MNYDWNVIARTGQPETGELIIYESNEARTKLILHHMSWDHIVRWISARFYTDHDATDGFLHWISDDVKDLLVADGCEFTSDFVMHVEFYRGNEELPFSLGDYTLE